MSARYASIDPGVLWRACGADREAFAALAQIFLDSAPASLARLELALAQQARPAAGAAAHALRGMTQLVGADALSLLLLRCEQAAGSGAPLPPAAPLAAAFALALAEVAHSLAHYQGEAP
jgi:HPt (histidine-containing phosphotransfer) domain-containing protein